MLASARALGPLSFALLDRTGPFSAALAAVWFRANFVSSGRRSGAAGSAAPVPDPKIAASDPAQPPAPASHVTGLD